MNIKYTSFLLSLLFIFLKTHADTITFDIPEVSNTKATSVSLPHRNTAPLRKRYKKKKSFTKSKPRTNIASRNKAASVSASHRNTVLSRKSFTKPRTNIVSRNKLESVSVSDKIEKTSSLRVKPSLGRNDPKFRVKQNPRRNEDTSIEEKFWNSAKNCNKANEIRCYKKYLARFPKGKYAVYAHQIVMKKPSINIKHIKRFGNYIDNGNGTIKHAWLNITWKKCSINQEFVKSKNICRGIAGEYTLIEAKKMVNLNWRLPTIKELKTLIYCSNGVSQSEAEDEGCKGKKNKRFTTPAINPLFSKTSNDSVTWSSDAYDSEHTKVLNFNLGYVDFYSNLSHIQVRLVKRKKKW